MTFYHNEISIVTTGVMLQQYSAKLKPLRLLRSARNDQTNFVICHCEESHPEAISPFHRELQYDLLLNPRVNSPPWLKMGLPKEGWFAQIIKSFLPPPPSATPPEIGGKLFNFHHAHVGLHAVSFHLLLHALLRT